MKENKNGSAPKRGMKRDLHINQLQDTDYPFALNTNTEQETGEGLNLTNEPSNYLAVNFPEGYKVIGKRKYLQGNKTFYILTNPETKKSSIGYVDDTLIESFNEDEYVNCSDCEGKNILSTPLEETTQTPTHTYIELINDECHEVGEGLDLDINYPIKFLNIKVEKGDVKLYWNDYKNPPRWLNTTDVSYLFIQEVPCDNNIIEDCVIIDKLLQFPKYGNFTINPKTLQVGGNLKKGTYEFYGAYCDLYGNNISEYFIPTNPIPIFDENDNILSQKDLDSYTNFAIKLEIENLNINYPYYKIVCVERTDVSGTASAFIEGIHPTTDNTVIYSSSGTSDVEGSIISGNKRILKRVDIAELYEVRTKYDKAKGTSAINGQQFMWGMYRKPEINLQPVVNLFGSLMKWQTSVAKEDLYKNGISSSKYKGYNRNEVQPFALRFWFKNGGYTSNFPIISRPSIEGERDVIDTSNPNRESIEANAPDCFTTDRTEKWQFLNTATSIGICEAGEGIETQSVEENITRSCIIEDLAEIPTNTISIEIDGSYVDLETYINENIEEVTNPSSDLYTPIGQYLEESLYVNDHCSANFEDNCEVAVLIEEEIYINGVENEQSTLVEKCIEDYTKSVPPLYCNLYKRDLTDGSFEKDLEFSEEFMPCGNPINDCLPVVYKREFNSYNEDCSYAENILNNNNPTQQGTTYFHNYYGADTLAELLDVDSRGVIYTDSDFQSTLHKGALFFKIEKNDRDSLIFEITKKSDCEKEDEISIGDTLRYNFYSTCNSTTPLAITIIEPAGTAENPCSYTPPTEGVVDMTEGLLVELDVTTYPDTFYVAIDAPITSESVPDTRPTPLCGCSGSTIKYRTAPICGCFGLFTRDVEYSFVDVSWDSIIVNKKEIYESECTFEIPIIGECDPVPYEYGEFAYWESIEEYPDNEELYNSSLLKILESDLTELSEYDKSNFEDFYTDDVQNGEYTLKTTTDFRCSKIRHPKLPDNIVAPFMNTISSAPFSETIIYPLGVKLDSEVVRTMLVVALNNNLITQEDYDNIEGYEILRADNSINKSVIASGLVYDMYKYEKKEKEYYYSNYPHNDLGDDFLHYEDKNRNSFIPHPFNSEKNNRFSFISPDVFLTKPALPPEIVFNGYQLGNSSGRFTDVEDHPKWVILGKDARTLASFLAAVESGLELAVKIAEFTTQGGAGHAWFIAGIASGTNAPGVGISSGATITFIIASSLAQFMKVGQYRYQWLQIFRDLGTVYNFAGYNVSHGYHNKFITNDKYFNEDNSVSNNEYLRGLSVKKYMKDGRYEYRDNTVTNNKLFVNNWGREESVFLSTGDFPIHYTDEYKNFDNSNLSIEQGSRTYLSNNDCTVDTDYERNVGSPYVTLKNYVPDQYGNIDSIKWLTTNYKFKLEEDNTCSPIYGGTIIISRFTWKRKLPLFTTTAMGEPDKLAFSYSQYTNIGSPRFYCDYESDSIENIVIPFPDIDSEYNFDCERGKNDFYVKPPSKMYLYYYGITDFLVESEINCNFRYGRKELKDNFYPSIGDMVRWTQEKNVPITEPNTFYYNNIYSLPVSNTPYKLLDSTFSKERQLLLSNQDNATIWSEKDVDENSPVDPWLIFKPLNWYEFPYDYGKLIELKAIEGGQVLARFEDKQLILNAVDNLADRMLPQTQKLGSGGIFSTRPNESNTSDLGFVGSQHHQTLSTPYGHVTVDAKRGKIHLTTAGGQETISESVGGQPTYMKNWFREQLPFKILRDIPDADVDNNYKGLGIAMGWDARFDRIFVTKKDYVALQEGISMCDSDFVISDESYYQDIIDDYISQGYTYEGISDCELCFRKTIYSITPTTDIYAYFDTTSMLITDAEAALIGLQTWFTNFQTANPTYTGNLYTIPTIQERYLLNMAYIQKAGTQFPNLNTAPEWAPYMNLPPNANTGSFVPPSDLVALIFNDESDPPYHNSGENNFTGQPTVGSNAFTGNYIDFRDNSYPLFDNFRAVAYPIAKAGGGFNIAATRNMVLHFLAAIEGEIITAEEVTALGITFDVSIINTTNPYKDYILPDSSVYVPLKEYGFLGIYDKISPADEVFSSEQFQEDLASFTNIGTEFESEDVVCIPLEKIELEDEEYFEEHSWTIAFKIGEGWISYYSFTPNYYSFHNEFFQTGYNYGESAGTLWSHTLNNTSLQVFQGVKYPWIVEVPLKNQNINKILKSAEINIEAKRYQNQWDYSEHKDVGFNKLVVYNNTNNSGNLNLVQQKSYKDTNKYPITNNDGTQDVLYTAENGKHYINYFYNRVKNQDNNVPIWLWEKNMINKTVNQQAVSFRGKSLLERIKGHQFLLRLTQDKESRYSIILKDVQTKEIIHE